MPCNQIRVTTCELINANREMLAQALLEEMTARGLFTDGIIDQLQWCKDTIEASYDGVRLVLSNRLGLSANHIKRAYSTQVVKAQAKKFGWKLQEKQTANREQRQFIALKR